MSSAISSFPGSMIKKGTANPPGNEYLAKEVIVNSLERSKARIEIIEGGEAPNMDNLVCCVKLWTGVIYELIGDK